MDPILFDKVSKSNLRRFQQSIITLPNLVLYYPFNEDSGTTVFNRAPATIGTNNGTNTGATVNQLGKSGKAYSFDGDDDFVASASGPSISPSGDFTYGVIFNIRTFISGGTTTNGSGNYIVDRPSGAPLFSFKILTTEKLCLQTRYDDNSGIAGTSSIDALTINTWYFAVGVRTYNTNFSLYLNGTFQNSSADTTKDLTPPILHFSRNGAVYSDQLTQHFFAVNRALSTTEISNLARSAGF